MAVVYNSVNGVKLEKLMAMNEGVQWELEDAMYNIAARAEHNLQQAEIRTGTAHIETLNVGNKDRDRYVILADSNVTNDEGSASNSALSIEFGREAYPDFATGEWKGAMDGLFVLTRAANLKPKKGKKSKAPKRPKSKRGSSGRFA